MHRIGIRPKRDRSTALFTLATEAPAALLARMFGGPHQGRRPVAASISRGLGRLRRRRQPPIKHRTRTQRPNHAQSVCHHWAGAPRTYPDDEGDYGRACEVDGYVGLIDVGGAQALVLGDMPARTTFLPQHNVLVREIAGDEDDANLCALVRLRRDQLPPSADRAGQPGASHARGDLQC